MNATDEARALAISASARLDHLNRVQERMAEATPDEMTRLIATGQVSALNADQKFLVEVATAEALVALALAVTGDDK
jgi:hypothetical protein